MTLLEATSHLLDVAKTFGRDDALTRRAIKRMEKRLQVLQLRSAKALRARRHKAWVDFECVYVHNYGSKCHQCSFEIGFGDFVKEAILTGRGHIKEFRCPACGAPLIGFFDDEDPPAKKNLPPTELLADAITTMRKNALTLLALTLLALTTALAQPIPHLRPMPARTNLSAIVTWPAPSNYAITNYAVIIYTNNRARCAFSTTNTTAPITNLTEGATYYITVTGLGVGLSVPICEGAYTAAPPPPKTNSVVLLVLGLRRGPDVTQMTNAEIVLGIWTNRPENEYFKSLGLRALRTNY